MTEAAALHMPREAEVANAIPEPGRRVRDYQDAMALAKVKRGNGLRRITPTVL